MDDTIQFANMDSWRGSSGKFGLTFKQIILMHINRCVLNGSCEWHGGYWNEIGYNPTTKTYVQNSRAVFNNSITMLRCLLLGYFDKEIKETDKKIQQDLSELEEEKVKDRGEHYDKKISLHIRLFEELIMLSKRLNFFEEETTEEEM